MHYTTCEDSQPVIQIIPDEAVCMRKDFWLPLSPIQATVKDSEFELRVDWYTR